MSSSSVFVNDAEKTVPDIKDIGSSIESSTTTLHNVGDLSTRERAHKERRLVRKLDARLLPPVVLIYMMNSIDLAISAARLKGLESDLHLSDIQYDTIVAILYVTYCLMQPPANAVLNRITRPTLYIGGLALLWGTIGCLSGLTRNFAGLAACRVIIGIPEAGLFPGSLYLLSRWYTRKELTFRSALPWVGMLLSNAFGNLIAAGILSSMEGKLGLPGWKWLFFIEGLIIIVIGLFCLWSLPDYPYNTRWLTPEELHLAQVRIAEDAAEADQDGAGDSMWQGFKMACTDIRVLLFALMSISQLLGMSFFNFFPTLTDTLGFSATTSLFLAVPPWIWSIIVLCLNALHADKSGERFFHIAVPLSGIILAYIIAISTSSVAGRYTSMFLMAGGYAGYALTTVWVSNTIQRPPTKRAAAIGIVNGFGNIGTLIGSYVWKESWAPTYHHSMEIGISSIAFSIFLAFIIRTILVQSNSKLDADTNATLNEDDRKRLEETARLEGITFEEALEKKRGLRYLC